MFDIKEIQKWEKVIDDAQLKRHCMYQKSLFDPRKDALIRHRNRSPWKRFVESPSARKKVQRKFKMRMKQSLIRNDECNPVPHDYRTYGWETW
jgi:hypothetical protein